jgi:hypothetical protein
MMQISTRAKKNQLNALEPARQHCDQHRPENEQTPLFLAKLGILSSGAGFDPQPDRLDASKSFRSIREILSGYLF